MKHLRPLPTPKETAPAAGRGPLPRAAMYRRTGTDKPYPTSSAPPRFGHDFTRVAVRPAGPAGHPKGVKSSCPFFSQRCPYGGACHRCPPKLQAKLKMGAPGDRFEQEADRVAARISNRPPPPVADGTVPRLRHAPGPAAPSAESTPEGVVRQALADPGRPLDPAVRQEMETHFGQAFGDVRVHAGAAADESARAVQSLAYTVGRHIVFRAGRYQPQISPGRRLLVHELTHVVQQTGGRPLARSRPTGSACAPCARTNPGKDEELQEQSLLEQDRGPQITPGGPRLSGVIQRAGDPAQIPPGFRCPTDLAPGKPAGTDILFPIKDAVITAAHTALLTTFRDAWVTAGGTDDILVHGYASEVGDQGPNWTLSCDRAEAVQAELVRLGIPAVRISIVAHGESTDFGTAAAPNQHAVVSSSAGGIFPLAFGILTPADNFAGRSVTHFGVGEVIDLNFASLPLRPAADFGGLEWHLAAGAGTLTAVTNAGTATYTAPATASAVRLELRVAAGATAGRVISSHAITIVIPSAVRMVAVAGSAPGFSPGGPIPAGSFGAGFQANPFIDPRDVSFQGVMFGEATAPAIVTPAGSFMSFTAFPHPAGGLVPGGPGNAVTGTPVLGVDSIFSGSRGPVRRFFGIPICGDSDFLWAIPWEFSVAGGPRTPFAGGHTANHHVVSTTLCNATIEKSGAGPFCRRINGTVC